MPNEVIDKISLPQKPFQAKLRKILSGVGQSMICLSDETDRQAFRWRHHLTVYGLHTKTRPAPFTIPEQSPMDPTGGLTLAHTSDDAINLLFTTQLCPVVSYFILGNILLPVLLNILPRHPGETGANATEPGFKLHLGHLIGVRRTPLCVPLGSVHTGRHSQTRTV